MGTGPCEQWLLLIKSRLAERKKLQEHPFEEIIDLCKRMSEFIAIVSDIGSCSVVNINSEGSPFDEKTLTERRLEREVSELQSKLDLANIESGSRILNLEQQLFDKQKLVAKLENRMEELNRRQKENAKVRISQIRRISELEILRQEFTNKNEQLEKQNDQLKKQIVKLKDANSLHLGGLNKIENDFKDLLNVCHRMNESISLLNGIKTEPAPSVPNGPEPRPGTSKSVPKTVLNAEDNKSNSITSRFIKTLPGMNRNKKSVTSSMIELPTNSFAIERTFSRTLPDWKPVLFSNSLRVRNLNSTKSTSSIPREASSPTHFESYYFRKHLKNHSSYLNSSNGLKLRSLLSFFGKKTNGYRMRNFEANSMKWVSKSAENDLKVLIGGTKGRIKVCHFDIETDYFANQQLERAEGTITSIDVVNKNVIASSTDKSCSFWSGVDGELKLRFLGHKSDVTSIKFVAGDKFISGSLDQMLKVWDIEKKKSFESFQCHSPVNDVDFYGPFDLASGHLDKTIQYWDIRSDSPISSNILSGEITSVSFSQNGWQILASSRGEGLVFIDFRTNRIVQTFLPECKQFTLANNLTRAALSPDSRLAAVGSAEGFIHIWSTVSNSELKRFKMIGGQAVFSVEWDERGKNLTCCSKNYSMTICDFDPYNYSVSQNLQRTKFDSPIWWKDESSRGPTIGLPLRY